MVNSSNKWFPSVKSDQKRIRLFCLPFAGGSSSTYRLWENYLPAFVDVCPVHLPGRLSRINEPSFSDISSLVNCLSKEIVPFLDIPFAFFGHSMGAIISFELIRRLREQNRFPLHLFISAARAPQLPSRTPDLHDLPDDEFKIELQKLNGTSNKVLNNKELFQLLMPTLRADFKLVEDYEFKEDFPLNCPITVFGGDNDEEVYFNELKEWSRQTEKSFKCKIFGGDHFYFDFNLEELLNLIRSDLESYL